MSAGKVVLKNALFHEQRELEGAGVRHVLKVGGDNRVLATFPEGQPALVQVPVQKGSIFYLAIPLVRDSMVELMEAVVAASGAQSPIRFLTPDGKHAPGLEYRAIKSGEDWLAFVNNLDRSRDQEVRLATDLTLAGVHNLTLELDLPPRFTVPAGETYILRLRHR